MTRKPEHPNIKKYRRERNGNIAAAFALLALATVLIAAPWILWGFSILSGEIAFFLGIFSTFFGAVAGVGGAVFVSEAWGAYMHQCAIRDKAEWREWHEQRREMERILREEGLK